MPTDSSTIKYEVDGRTATITLNRPEALNALSPHMITELRAAYDEAESDDKVWLLIVTGTGRAFCTGADVSEWFATPTNTPIASSTAAAADDDHVIRRERCRRRRTADSNGGSKFGAIGGSTV